MISSFHFLLLLHVNNLHRINTSSVVSMFPKNMKVKCNTQGRVKSKVSNWTGNVFERSAISVR